MSTPRGRRTRAVAVYLSPVEADAWDRLRDLQRGAGCGGTYPPSRAAWVMERVWWELARLSEQNIPGRSEPADQALQALEQEERRLGSPGTDKAHGRIRRPPVGTGIKANP